MLLISIDKPVFNNNKGKKIFMVNVCFGITEYLNKGEEACEEKVDSDGNGVDVGNEHV